MVPNVLTHLTACALGLLLGYSLCARSRRTVRRRTALRWAFERASADAERARRAEVAIRAELEAALRRERTARDETERTKALAATLEAEVVAMRRERDELQERSRRFADSADRLAMPATALAETAHGDGRAQPSRGADLPALGLVADPWPDLAGPRS